MNWTLDKELQKVMQTTSTTDALQQLGLIREGSHFDLTHDTDWVRGGAETFIFRFWINACDETKGYIIKACVALGDIHGTTEIIERWIHRRDMISAHGVRTPKLIYFGNGIIIEELIPFRLKSLLLQNVNVDRSILIQLSEWTAVFCKLGFIPVDPYTDLRSNGDDVIVIDFGQDLGQEGFSNVDYEQQYQLLIREFQRWGVILNPEEKVVMRTTFEQKLRESHE